MHYDVAMPQLGMTMTEGAVVAWLKKVGDSVEKGEMLFVVETDKVEMEIESPGSGKLAEIGVEVGQMVPVGSVIARIEGPEEDPVVAARPHVSRPITSSPQPGQSAGGGSEFATEPATHSFVSDVPASPRAKKMAKQRDVDLLQVRDYQGKGRIDEADVLRFLEEHSAVEANATIGSSSARPKEPKREVPSGVRRTIAARMTASFQTVPHFYLTVEADATGLRDLREDLANEVERQISVRLSYTDLLLKALATALERHPEINTSWQDAIIHRDHIDIGLAVQTLDRLLVPVVRDANHLSLLEVAKVRSALAEKARTGKLQPDDSGNASCTLSNLGPGRVDHFQAIINPPESVILATGSILPRPFVVNGAVVPRPTVCLSLSVDHRLIDGSTASSFLGTLTRLIESPAELAGA